MDIRKLRIFIMAAKTQSFTKAAAALYMSQPAVSKAIQELETEANTLLFERYAKQSILTPAGKVLLSKAEALLQLHDEIQRELPQLDAHSTLRIGSSITIANETLPKMIKALQMQYEDLQIEVDIAMVEKMIQKLKNNEIDIAFVEGVIEEDDFISIPFSCYTIKAVCSPAFFKANPVHTLTELCTKPLLLREKGSAIRDALDSFLLLNDIIVKPAWTSTNSNALLQAAINDLGIAFLPENMILKKQAEQALIAIEIHSLHLKNHTHLIYKKQKHLNLPMQTLIHFAEKI